MQTKYFMSKDGRTFGVKVNDNYIELIVGKYGSIRIVTNNVGFNDDLEEVSFTDFDHALVRLGDDKAKIMYQMVNDQRKPEDERHWFKDGNDKKYYYINHDGAISVYDEDDNLMSDPLKYLAYKDNVVKEKPKSFVRYWRPIGKVDAEVYLREIYANETHMICMITKVDDHVLCSFETIEEELDTNLWEPTDSKGFNKLYTHFTEGAVKYADLIGQE